MAKGKTFAEAAEALGRKKRKFEKVLENSTDRFARNSAVRMIGRIDSLMDELFQEQQSLNNNNTGDNLQNFAHGGKLPKMQTGGIGPEIINALQGLFGSIGKGAASTPGIVGGSANNLLNLIGGSAMGNQGNSPLAGLPSGGRNFANIPLPGGFNVGRQSQSPGFLDRIGAGIRGILGDFQFDPKKTGDHLANFGKVTAPFIDNIAQRRAINNLQSPAQPVLNDPARLKTEFNINPALRDAREAQRSFNLSADQNLSNSAQAATNKISAFANRIRNTGDLFARKENIETGLTNQANLINNQIQQGNNATVNRFNQENIDFENNRRIAKANNVSNAALDLQGIIRDRTLDQRDLQKIQILSKQFNPGVLARAFGDVGILEPMIEFLGANDPESPLYKALIDFQRGGTQSSPAAIPSQFSARNFANIPLPGTFGSGQ